MRALLDNYTQFNRLNSISFLSKRSAMILNLSHGKPLIVTRTYTHLSSLYYFEVLERTAAASGVILRTAALLLKPTIFSAEAYAICLALDICEQHDRRIFVIFTDSMSVLQSLLN